MADEIIESDLDLASEDNLEVTPVYNAENLPKNNISNVAKLMIAKRKIVPLADKKVAVEANDKETIIRKAVLIKDNQILDEFDNERAEFINIKDTYFKAQEGCVYGCFDDRDRKSVV